MLTFHNDEKIKARYVERVREHLSRGEILQSSWLWDGTRGCAVGATIHAMGPGNYPEELGIAYSIGRMEDAIFSQLPKSIAPQFALDFLEAVPVGVDLDIIRWRFGHYIFSDVHRTFLDIWKRWKGGGLVDRDCCIQVATEAFDEARTAYQNCWISNMWLKRGYS